MDPVLILLLALFGFMLVGSIVAVETRDLLSSIICLGAVGFGTSVAFLLLGAPDLAITQVVVEILVLVVLVRVVITRKDETQATSRSTLAVGSVMLVPGVLVAVMFWMLAGAGDGRLKMRAFGDPLMNETAAAATAAPAGGFAGGVILAGALVLIVLAFGEEFSRKVLPHGVAQVGDSLGAMSFLLVALFGYMAGGFFVNFLPPGEPCTLFSAGTIPISNLAIGVKVGAGLFSAFLALALFRRQSDGNSKSLIPGRPNRGGSNGEKP